MVVAACWPKMSISSKMTRSVQTTTRTYAKIWVHVSGRWFVHDVKKVLDNYQPKMPELMGTPNTADLTV